jgi:hypothetical protein
MTTPGIPSAAGWEEKVGDDDAADELREEWWR